MIHKIKEYITYKRHIKTAKKEFAQIAASALPSLRQTVEQQAETLDFIHNLISDAREMEGEKLIAMVLDKAADRLCTDQPRLVQIMTCIAGLSPEDIQKIITHAMVETLPENADGNEPDTIK